MKIVCTKEEKKAFIKDALDRGFCPFIDCEDYEDCKECLTKRLKWLTVKE